MMARKGLNILVIYLLHLHLPPFIFPKARCSFPFRGIIIYFTYKSYLDPWIPIQGKNSRITGMSCSAKASDSRKIIKSLPIPSPSAQLRPTLELIVYLSICHVRITHTYPGCIPPIQVNSTYFSLLLPWGLMRDSQCHFLPWLHV